jgi:hypothetical protein
VTDVVSPVVVDEFCSVGFELVAAVDVEGVDGASGEDVFGDEFVDGESPDGASVSARATPRPCPVPTAAPTPSATASAPTRPMYRE